MSTFLLELIKVQEHLKQMRGQVKEYVQTPTNEDRWEAFCAAGRLGIIPSVGSYFEPDGIDWDKHTMYDTFYIDKYKTYNPIDLEEMCLDKDIFLEGDENHKRFRESWMKEFVWNVENNW